MATQFEILQKHAVDFSCQNYISFLTAEEMLRDMLEKLDTKVGVIFNNELLPRKQFGKACLINKKRYEEFRLILERYRQKQLELINAAAMRGNYTLENVYLIMEYDPNQITHKEKCSIITNCKFHIVCFFLNKSVSWFGNSDDNTIKEASDFYYSLSDGVIKEVNKRKFSHDFVIVPYKIYSSSSPYGDEITPDFKAFLSTLKGF